MPHNRNSRNSRRRNRRPAGSGSIQVKRAADGSSVYYAVVAVGGKRIWRRAGTDARQAQQRLNELLVEFAGQAPQPEPTAVRLIDYGPAWIEKLRNRPPAGRRRKLKESTVRGYEAILKHVLIPCLGEKQLHRIEIADVEELVEGRTGGYAPVTGKAHLTVTVKTAMNEVQVLASLMRCALRDYDHITENPCLSIGAWDHTPRRRVLLREREIFRLADKAGPQNRCLVLLLGCLGLRIGEALAVKWARDFDAGSRRLTIHESWSHSLLDSPKSKTSRRTLQLSEPLATEIGAQINRVKDRRNPEGLLFPSALGGYIDPGWWRKTVFYPAAEAGRLPSDLTPHHLRHSFAVNARRNGMTMDQLRHTLGHSSITVTMDLYGWMDAGEFGQAADIFAFPEVDQIGDEGAEAA